MILCVMFCWSTNELVIYLALGVHAQWCTWKNDIVIMTSTAVIVIDFMPYCKCETKIPLHYMKL